MPDWESRLKEELGPSICNYPCSKLDSKPHILRAPSSSVHACGEVVLIAPTGHVTPQKSTCNDQRLQSQQVITTASGHWRRSHTSEYSWLFQDSEAVCLWLWLYSSTQEKNQMFLVRPCCDTGVVTIAFREHCVIFALLRAGTGTEGLACWKGVARKTLPRNDEARISAIWWPLLWN